MNASLPKISIVMPIKDTAFYLEECLQSIVTQTFLNWELIAVNEEVRYHPVEIIGSELRESMTAMIKIV